MKTLAKGFWGAVKNAFSGWSLHKVPRLSAALAYYTAFSIGPLILIAISLAGLVFGADAARGQVFEQLRGLLGDEAASGVQTAVKSASKPGSSIVAAILGIASLLFGASGVFGELHDALNTIWGVKAKANQGVLAAIKQRFFSLSMVLGTGFLLLVSLLLSAGLSVVGEWLSSSLPGGEALWTIINFAFSLLVIAGVFTLLFKYVPDVKIRWRETLIAGFVTSALFTLGRFGLGLYISKAGIASSYGAAGSMIVLLLWVYYAAQILYFGTELSRALAEAFRTEVKPTRTAEKVQVDEKEPAPPLTADHGRPQPQM